MIHLELNSDEMKMWLDILEYDLKDLRNEISNTEKWEYKDRLKKKEKLLKKLKAIIEKEESNLSSVDIIL